MKKILVFICIAAIAPVLISLSSCKSGNASYLEKSYTDMEFKFTVSYPSDWTRAQYEPLAVFFQAPERDNFNASLGILADKEDTALLEKNEKDFFEENSKYIENFKIIDFKKTRYLDSDCIVVTFDSTGDFGDLRQKEYIFNRNGTLFVLVFTALQSNFAQYLATFDKMADSFYFAG